MFHTGTYCILVHNISEINEKTRGNLILHSSRGLTGIRNLIWLDHWEEEGKAAGQYWEVEGKRNTVPYPGLYIAQKMEGLGASNCRAIAVKAAETRSRL